LPTRRIWTQYGLCVFEIAEVLAEQGVETELVWTDEGWLTDDEGWPDVYLRRRPAGAEREPGARREPERMPRGQ